MIGLRLGLVACTHDMVLVVFFFFQAEDGIRDLTVTGVQTCALPICLAADGRPGGGADRGAPGHRVGHQPPDSVRSEDPVLVSVAWCSTRHVSRPPDRKSVV